MLHDLRTALQQLRRTPGFACAVVVTLALVIGANTAAFSLVNALILRTLPVRDPEGLVLLQATDGRGQQNRAIYQSTFAHLARLPVFETLVLYSGGGGFPIEVRGARHEGLIEASTPGLFETLGVQPHLGRFFTSEDASADGPASDVVVLSHAFWGRAFGGDPRAVGETILVDGLPLEVIGVTAPGYKGFHVDGGYGFSVPLSVLNRRFGTDPKRPIRGLNAVGRLKSGVSLDSARAAVEAAWPALRVDAVPAGISQTERAEIATQQIKVESLSTGFSSLRRRYEEPLKVLSAIAALLLILGCVNLSGLLLARAAARDRYLLTCLALGATRGRLVRQVLVQSVVLAAAGTAIALPLAWWATRLAGTLLWQGTSPLALSLTPDLRVLTLTAAVAVATALVISLLPSWRAGRLGFGAWRWADRGLTHGPTRVGKGLLAAQVAVSLVLVVAAVLLSSSLANLRNLEIGVRTDGVRWSRLYAVPGGYRGQNDAAYYPELVRQLSEVPGVASVALASYFPTYFALGDLVSTQSVAPAGDDDRTTAADGIMENVSPGFFQTVGIPMVRGRDFSWTDDAQHPAVAIINDSLSRAIFPRGDAVGQRIRIGKDPRRATVEVVGVVGDAAIASYKKPHVPVAFRPRMQELAVSRAPVMLFRSSGDPAGVDKAMAAVIAGLGHEYPRRVYALDEHVSLSLLAERLLAGLSVFFGGLAVLLAFVGLYGVLAYAVARRTREIGVRAALGAPRAVLVRMVVWEGLVLTLLGVAVGVPCSLAASRLLRSSLFGLEASNLPALVSAAVFVVFVGATAALVPAIRASRVDPITALRVE